MSLDFPWHACCVSVKSDPITTSPSSRKIHPDFGNWWILGEPRSLWRLIPSPNSLPSYLQFSSPKAGATAAVSTPGPRKDWLLFLCSKSKTHTKHSCPRWVKCPWKAQATSASLWGHAGLSGWLLWGARNRIKDRWAKFPEMSWDCAGWKGLLFPFLFIKSYNHQPEVLQPLIYK